MTITYLSMRSKFQQLTHKPNKENFVRVYNLMINLLMGNFLIINASIIRLSNKKENNYKLYVVACNGQNARTLQFCNAKDLNLNSNLKQNVFASTLLLIP